MSYDSEDEYVTLLEHERRMYAWCLERYAALSPETARERAEAFYRYEDASAPHRGLLLHDQAWFWAMKHIFGSAVWKERPDLREPSPEYRAHDDRTR